MSNKQKDERLTHELYWEELRQKEPADVCQRTEATFSTDRKGYILPFLNQKYMVLPQEQKIILLEGNSDQEIELRDYFYLIVLLYLLHAQEVEPTRIWISEKELKGGVTFFRGPHALRVEELKEAFGHDPDGFLQAGKKLGGVELFFGDKAFALPVFPKVPLAYVLWKGDEEFPPQITVMFDSTIEKHFSLDGIWCLVAEVSQRLLETKQK
ncbi:MAG: DUF3786 domain-containing protein [Thermodesulfobacteriota bacterium]